MAKISRRFNDAKSKIDKSVIYSLSDAIKLAKETATVKFDSTVEASFNLNLDPRKVEQQLRGAIVLPAGTGKTQKILVLTNTKTKEAQEAGADFVGGEDLINKIKTENWFEFDVIVATPEIMAKLGAIGKILGPKGLMPNPKTGTVTLDVAKTINEIKKGKIEYRTDKEGNIHTIIGKSSFSVEKLEENYNAVWNELLKIKPQTVKGNYVKNITISTTMGPGIKVKF